MHPRRVARCALRFRIWGFGLKVRIWGLGFGVKGAKGCGMGVGVKSSGDAVEVPGSGVYARSDSCESPSCDASGSG